MPPGNWLTGEAPANPTANNEDNTPYIYCGMDNLGRGKY